MATKSKHDDYPVKVFTDGKTFEKWLSKNFEKDGVWLKMAKAKSGIKTVNYADALEVALCYGWIDGMRKGLDATYFVQKFTPRRPNSIWSAVNKKKVTALIKAGKMKPSGKDAINAAKKNGRWSNAYDSQAKISIPADLSKAFDENPEAKAFFEKLNSQNRYSILFRLGNVKREATKKKKIEEYVAMLEKHETIYPQKF